MQVALTRQPHCWTGDISPVGRNIVYVQRHYFMLTALAIGTVTTPGASHLTKHLVHHTPYPEVLRLRQSPIIFDVGRSSVKEVRCRVRPRKQTAIGFGWSKLQVKIMSRHTGSARPSIPVRAASCRSAGAVNRRRSRVGYSNHVPEDRVCPVFLASVQI